MTYPKLYVHFSMAKRDLIHMWHELDAPYLRLSDNRLVHISYKATIMCVMALAATITGIYLACEDLLKLLTLKRPG